MASENNNSNSLVDTLSGIGSVGSFATSLFNTISNIGSDYRSYKYSKKLMDYQNQINLENWNLQNEYNSPSNQMQLYRDAGINPNLYASSLSGSSATSQSVPSVSNSQFKTSQRPVDFSQMTDIALKNQQIKNSEKLTEAQINYLLSQTKGQNLQNEITEQTGLDTAKQYLHKLQVENYINDKTANDTITDRKNKALLSSNMVSKTAFELKEILPRQVQLLDEQIQKEKDENSLFELRKEKEELYNEYQRAVIAVERQAWKLNNDLHDYIVEMYKGNASKASLTSMVCEMYKSLITLDDLSVLWESYVRNKEYSSKTTERKYNQMPAKLAAILVGTAVTLGLPILKSLRSVGAVGASSVAGAGAMALPAPLELTQGSPFDSELYNYLLGPF